MGFWQDLFGGTFESNRQLGIALFDDKQYGEAKLAFERAIGKAKGAPRDEVESLKAKIRECRLALARARMREAAAFSENGEFEQAQDLLRDVLEICDDPAIAAEVKQRNKEFEARAARQLVEEAGEISEDELLSIIAGTWTEAQAEEYAEIFDDIKEAVLASHDGDHVKAAALFEVVAENGDLPITPCYLFFDLGRARMAAGLFDGAALAFGTFLSRVGDDGEALDSVVAALTLKADALLRLGRKDEAKEQFIEATRRAPRDHKVFANLGIFLRHIEEYEASYKALLKAAELMGTMNPDFSVIRELGFTCLAKGDKAEGKRHLKAVIDHIASRGEFDQIDPIAAVTLAKLEEESGDFKAAADLFRHLAEGHDTRNHFTYNLEAARLLAKGSGDKTLIERYLFRAAELAENDEQQALFEKVRAEALQG